jgi:hypothetical protein
MATAVAARWLLTVAFASRRVGSGTAAMAIKVAMAASAAVFARSSSRADCLRQRRAVQVHRRRHRGTRRPWRRVRAATASPWTAIAGSVIAGQGCSLKDLTVLASNDPSRLGTPARYRVGCERLIASKTYRTASAPCGECHCSEQYSDHDRAFRIYGAVSLSAWLTRNAEGASYHQNCEACRQSRRKIWEAHHHRGSAEGRAGRTELPGCPVPVRLRQRTDDRSSLRCVR